MKTNTFLLIPLLVSVSFFFTSCKDDSSSHIQQLRDDIHQSRPISQVSTFPKLSDEDIKTIIHSRVDGFLFKGLNREMKFAVLAEIEFDEILTVNYYDETQTCEVLFSFFMLQEEFRGQETFESDGMTFIIEKQPRQGKGLFKYSGTQWELQQLNDIFFQIDFLSKND